MVCTRKIFIFIGSFAGPDQCGQHRHVLLSKILIFIYLYLILFVYRLLPTPKVVHYICRWLLGLLYINKL